jgi:type II secretory ATPase GspE/PulE/Tfp pilus assembly ATPase PilB-like protein
MRQIAVDPRDAQLSGLDPADPLYATQAVDHMLAQAQAAGASDLHLQPTAEGLELKFRIDGVLQTVAVVPLRMAPNVVARLKVRAELLTYRTDMPQEGRIRVPQSDVEMRVSTFPTLFGERAVVRLFGRSGQYEQLDDLGLPPDLLPRLRLLLGETSGAILISGPAGSGKTTTVYACLRELVGQSGGSRSLVSLEDPIEVAVGGVAQSQVNATAGLDLATGLRFLMRQDPEVIMVGEIRDRPTAEAALQAALTGHLLLSTFHAGSAVETLGRLLDMAIEPYVLRSGLLVIINQRLLRRLCTCAEMTEDPAARLGLPIAQAWLPRGCEACGGTGYRGRFLVVEMLSFHTAGMSGPQQEAAAALGRAVLARADTTVLEPLAAGTGMVTRWHRAIEAAAEGRTSPAEIRRVLGVAVGLDARPDTAPKSAATEGSGFRVQETPGATGVSPVRCPGTGKMPVAPVRRALSQPPAAPRPLNPEP